MIFIVGNSRSGTTMLGRIFGMNTRVHTFGELHFFEQMIDSDTLDADPQWSDDKLLKLAERLITSSREGLFFDVPKGKYTTEVKAIITGLEHRGPVSLYKAILHAQTAEAGKTIPLEQTPRYLFTAAEILDAFPDSHIINIIRDPRDVMLSQKNRWKRGKLSGSSIPPLWTVRSWANYHPFTTSKLWTSAVKMADRMTSHPRFHSISYEGLLSEPEPVLRGVCEAIGLPYEPEMLRVAHVGSSMGMDKPNQRGLDKSRIGSWKNGRLTSAEIAICEQVAGEQMRAQGYELSGRSANWLSVLAVKAGFPIKLAFAGLVNLNRFRNLPQIVKRRLA